MTSSGQFTNAADLMDKGFCCFVEKIPVASVSTKSQVLRGLLAFISDHGNGIPEQR